MSGRSPGKLLPQSTRHRDARRLTELVLLVLPLCEVLIAQIQGTWSLSLGAVSFAQACHILGLMGFGIAALRCPVHMTRFQRLILDHILFFAMSIVLPVGLAAASRGLSMEDLVNASQIVYWILAFIYVLGTCAEHPHYSQVLLTGLRNAGLYMAVSVIACHLAFGDTYSAYKGISASFGGFSTGKSLGGILVTALLLSVYWYANARPWQGLVGFCLCGVAVLLTYQRAAQVAFVLAWCWLLIWALWSVRGEARRYILRLTLLVTLAVPVFLFAGGLDSLQLRWADVGHGSKAGSGRIGLWRGACDTFVKSPWIYKILGSGYSGMLDSVEERGMSARRKHTHSDFFDILLSYGLCAFLGWLSLLLALWRLLGRCSYRSYERALSVAVLLTFITESSLTGQMTGLHVMLFYTATITAFSGLARRSAVLGVVASE